MTMWKVTAGRGNAFARQFIDGNMVAIGWRQIGEVTAIASKPALLDIFQHAFPDNSPRKIVVGAGQVWRFVKEMQVDDGIITYDPQTRLYHIGRITSPAIYAPKELEELPTRRSVAWSTTRSRDDLSPTTRNSLGAILTLFRVPDAADRELRDAGKAALPIDPVFDGPATIDADIDPYEAMSDQALERTKDRISQLGWDQMQELVASLLRALGYRTIVSPMGADRGKDIIASKDGFGFEQPRIVVEVKHRTAAMGAQEIRSFLGGRHADDRGLYVSTGGFTRDAQYEAERASTVTHLMNLDGLARAIIDQYDQMDERGRKLLPMTRLYWPD